MPAQDSVSMQLYRHELIIEFVGPRNNKRLVDVELEDAIADYPHGMI